MSLPRLKQVGDSVLIHVTKCIPVDSDTIGPAVEFTGTEPADVIVWPRAGVDVALRRLGYCFGEKKGDDSIVDYAGVVGEWLRFSINANTNGGRPLWRIEKSTEPNLSGEKPQKAPATAPATSPRGEVPPGQPVPPDDIEARRQAIRDAYARELVYAVQVLVPLLKGKKVAVQFHVNAAAAALTSEMSRKRCL